MLITSPAKSGSKAGLTIDKNVAPPLGFGQGKWERLAESMEMGDSVLFSGEPLRACKLKARHLYSAMVRNGIPSMSRTEWKGETRIGMRVWRLK